MASAPFRTIPLDPDFVDSGEWRIVEEHGFLVLTGDFDASLIPDHRALREERVDELIQRSFGEGSS